MFRMYGNLCLFSLLAITTISTQAQTTNEHFVIAPACLIKNITPHQSLAATHDLTFISVDEGGIDALISAKLNDKTRCGGFMDVTQEWRDYIDNKSVTRHTAADFLHKYTHPAKPKKKLHYTIQYEKQVNQLLTQLNPQAMWNDLTALTQFEDRYANSDNGVKAADWLKTQVEAIAKENGRNDVTVTLIKTGEQYKQPSVIIKIGDAATAGIVIGAHMDTLNNRWGKMPGADDDGSGTATVLEATRTLLASGMHFKKPVYIAWYAAEEEGLVGSRYVVTEFKKKNIPVDAVLHFDLTGYAHKKDPTIWLITDYVNKDLTAYLEKLINTYVKQPVQHTACGYACSDHATWTQNGFAAAIPAEAAYENTNPVIHTSQDTMDRLSLAHMTDYAKLAVAFAVELAEPKQ